MLSPLAMFSPLSPLATQLPQSSQPQTPLASLRGLKPFLDSIVDGDSLKKIWKFESLLLSLKLYHLKSSINRSG
jgi:hypothetical protein